MGYIEKDRSNIFFRLFCLVKVVAINEVLPEAALGVRGA